MAIISEPILSIAHQSNKTAYALNVVKIESEACSIAKLYVRFCHGEPEESLLIDIRQMLDSSPKMMCHTRYFSGCIPSLENLERIFRVGNQLHRRYAALYIKRLEPQEPMRMV